MSGDLAKPLEPSYDELNPPPEPEKEYRFSLGDTVHIGADEYSILSIDDKSVLLNDSKFPLLCEEMKREEFDRKIAEIDAVTKEKANAFAREVFNYDKMNAAYVGKKTSVDILKLF